MSKAQRDPAGPNEPPDPSPCLLSPAHLCFSYFIKSQFLCLLLSGYCLSHSPLYSLWNALIHKTSLTFVYCLQSLWSLLIIAFALKSTPQLDMQDLPSSDPTLIPRLTCALSCAVGSSEIYSHWVSSGFLLSMLFSLSSLFLLLEHWGCHLYSHGELLPICLLKYLLFPTPCASYLCLHFSLPCCLPNKRSVKIQELPWNTKQHQSPHFTLTKSFELCAITTKYIKYMLCFSFLLFIISRLLKKRWCLHPHLTCDQSEAKRWQEAKPVLLPQVNSNFWKWWRNIKHLWK